MPRLLPAERMSPIRLCSHPGCPDRSVYRGKCQTHARAINQATHRNRHVYNTSKWQHTRRAIITAQPLCPGVMGQECGAIVSDVHHITDLSKGGAPYDPANLLALCRPCHSRLTRHELLGNAPYTPLIAVTGPIASGKTTWCQAFTQAHPDWRHLSIDLVREHGGDWPDLIDIARTITTPHIIESVAAPADYLAILKHRHATLITVTINETIRRQRLRARGWQYKPVAYDDSDHAAIIIDGTQPLDPATIDLAHKTATGQPQHA